MQQDIVKTVREGDDDVSGPVGFPYFENAHINYEFFSIVPQLRNNASSSFDDTLIFLLPALFSIHYLYCIIAWKF